MKSLMFLLQEVLNDLGNQCGVRTALDMEYVESRVEREGYEFLTLTLPSYGQQFERCLADGQVNRYASTDDGHNIPFIGLKYRGSLPVFLGGFFDLVFDRESGLLLENPDTTAIFALRQIFLMFGKINRPCTPARVEAALSQYVETEKELSEYVDFFFSEESISDCFDSVKNQFRRISRLLFAPVLAEMDQTIFDLAVRPKHGPGATADKLTGNGKWRQTEWTQRLEEIFPVGEFLLPNWSHHTVLDRVTFLEPEAERPVKVITVPKTLKAPRIIAIEPACMQYTQQSIMRPLVRLIEGDSFVSPFIGFTNQTPNQEMAREGSLTGSLATLDLSEASDRVSNLLVQLLVEDYPWLAKALDATRSRNASVSGHGVIPLTKFASMGSALCFPMMAMCLTTIVFIGIEMGNEMAAYHKAMRGWDGRASSEPRVPSIPLDRKAVRRLRGKVRVYGDDIVIPTDHASSVRAMLEVFGLKLNLAKSFWTGSFRESCGKEYFNGDDVSIVRVRETLPTDVSEVPEIVSTVSLRNQLYKAELWQVAKWLDSWIRGVIPFPTVDPTSPLLGRHSLYFDYEVDRMCSRLQRPLVRGAKVQSRLPRDPLEGPDALLKVLLMLEERNGALVEAVYYNGIDEEIPWFVPSYQSEPALGEDHLEFSGRPLSVSIKIVRDTPF